MPDSAIHEAAQLDPLVRLAAELCACTAAGLVLADGHGEPFFAARLGWEEATPPAALHFGAQVIVQRRALSAAATAGGFFHGLPLPGEEGEATGALVVHGPQALAPAQQQALHTLAEHIAGQLAWHRRHAAQRLQAETEARLDARARAQVLQIQQEIATAQLDPAAGLHHVMALLAERLLALTGAHGCAIDLVEADELVCCAAAGVSTSQLGLRLPVDASLAGTAVKGNTLVYCEDVRLSPVAVPLAAHLAPSVRSALMVPLRAGTEVIGVLKLQSEQVGAFGGLLVFSAISDGTQS